MRLACWALLLAACASTGVQAQPETPGATPSESPSPAAPPSAGAEADLRTAVAHFSRAASAAARRILEPLLARLDDHPQRTTAAALLARVMLADGDASGARHLLEVNAPGAAGGLEPDVAFVRGVAESRLGNGRQAVALLAPF